MSVATHLGLGPASTAFIDLEQHWGAWVDQFPRLARARDFHMLRGWLAAAEPAEADEVLHTLATLGSPSGADDLAAASVLADHGVEGFTLRECARRAGVSHGAPAHHFGDVRGLLSAFTAQSFEQLEAVTRDYQCKAPPDGFSQLLASGTAYVHYALNERARFQLMFRSDRLDASNEHLRRAGQASIDKVAVSYRVHSPRYRIKSSSARDA